MRRIGYCIFLTLGVLLMVACGRTKEEEPRPMIEEPPLTAQEMRKLGEKLFNGKGTCNACHQPETKGVGPSIKEIAEIYEAYQASIVTFLRGEGEAIVDPKQFRVMEANFAITKKMSNQELEAIEHYMKSL